ncbi:hypothetical protein Mapa_005456 [Marchantia paleacea]|nr:hypothetical protein Mapa_005456 [Marchantia paleacea]
MQTDLIASKTELSSCTKSRCVHWSEPSLTQLSMCLPLLIKIRNFLICFRANFRITAQIRARDHINWLLSPWLLLAALLSVHMHPDVKRCFQTFETMWKSQVSRIIQTGIIVFKNCNRNLCFNLFPSLRAGCQVFPHGS